MDKIQENKKKFKIERAEVYLSANCNLQCSYCFISKNPNFYALNKDIQRHISDGVLEANILKVFKGKEEDLTCLSLWGAEPTMGFNEFGKILYNLLNTYPNLNQFRTSTNFTNKLKDLTDFIDLLSNYERDITFNIQISMDGDESINDTNRGFGVTQSIKNNLEQFIDYYNNINLKNLKLSVHFKPTLTVENLKQMVDMSKSDNENIDSVIKYHRFFDDLHYNLIEKNKNNSITFTKPPIITLVTPGKFTVDDGKFFAYFVDILERACIKNRNEKILKYYEDFNFFKLDVLKLSDSYDEGRELGYCGIFESRIAIFPMENAYVGGCHRSYPDLSEDYINTINKNDDLNERGVLLSNAGLRQSIRDNFFWKDDPQDMEKMRKKMSLIYKSHAFSITSLASMIYQASLVGQVDKVYSEDNAKLLRVAYIIRGSIPCLYDNLATTGTFQMRGMSKLKLYCNGAIEKLFEYYPVKRSE